MRKYLWFVLVSLLLFCFITCSSEQKIETEIKSEEVSTESENAKAICKACGMEMKKDVMISQTIDGEKAYFCNEFCRDHYLSAAKESKKEE